MIKQPLFNILSKIDDIIKGYNISDYTLQSEYVVNSQSIIIYKINILIYVNYYNKYFSFIYPANKSIYKEIEQGELELALKEFIEAEIWVNQIQEEDDK